MKTASLLQNNRKFTVDQNQIIFTVFKGVKNVCFFSFIKYITFSFNFFFIFP